MFYGQRDVQGDGQVYAEGEDKSEDPMAQVLHGAQHREKCVENSAAMRGIRGTWRGNICDKGKKQPVGD